METLVPVAEESGVTLAAHPDDPPMPMLRETPRLVYRTDRFQHPDTIIAEIEEKAGDVSDSVQRMTGPPVVRPISDRPVLERRVGRRRTDDRKKGRRPPGRGRRRR